MSSSAPVTSAGSADTVRTYVESFAVEDEVLAAARDRAHQLGVAAVSPAVAGALCFLATVAAARTVVEVGTGAGVSGLALLRGMRPDGVLTTIDTEPEHQRSARQAFTDGGYAGGRYRLINGRAVEVLPRLTDAGYDVAFVDTRTVDYPRYLAEAARLLRPGGVVVLHGALSGGHMADPARRDAPTVALRGPRTLTEDETWLPVLVPLGEGLLAAARVDVSS